MPFAHFEGEDPEMTAAYVAALRVELEGRRARGDDADDVIAELDRMGIRVRVSGAEKSTRLRAAGKETR